MRMKTVEEESVIYYKRFFLHLANHKNPLIRNLNIATLPEKEMVQGSPNLIL
jgi:hypothetical protein